MPQRCSCESTSGLVRHTLSPLYLWQMCLAIRYHNPRNLLVRRGYRTSRGMVVHHARADNLSNALSSSWMLAETVFWSGVERGGTEHADLLGHSASWVFWSRTAWCKV